MFRRFFCFILLLLLCFSMVGCKGVPQGSATCKKCQDGIFLSYDKGWIYLSDREEYHNVLNATYNIINVTNKSSYSGTIEGNFNAIGVLVFYHSSGSLSGNINEKETYTFFYATPDGGYKKMSIPADSTTIYYTNETPHIELLTQYGKYWVCDKCKTENYNWKVDFYRIYIPEGSITGEYKLD